MITAELFSAAVLGPTALTNLAVRLAWDWYDCPAWAARVSSRFMTLMIGVGTILEVRDGRSGHAWLDFFCVLLGVLFWDYPKDDQPPRRRRQKKEVVEEKAGFDWSGTAQAHREEMSPKLRRMVYGR